MRSRFVVLALVLGSLVALAAQAVAAPQHDKRLTINATPNPSVTGEAILIYGQLNTADHGGKLIRLFHRIAPRRAFTLVQTTRTSAAGFYEFTRVDGVVTTNRSWFVRGPGATHSRTVHERVAATITLASGVASGTTNHPVTFTGQVTPGGHAGEPVMLQQQTGDTGNGWKTIGRGTVGPNSSYAIAHNFKQPGGYTLRTVLRADTRNLAADSNPTTIPIEQAQNPAFTIATSAPIVTEGDQVNISGVLYAPGSTTPLPSTGVTLWGHASNSSYQAISSTSTGADGSYSFTQVPVRNMVYEVRATLTPKRSSAQLFEGVKDVVTISASSLTALVGQQVTLGGVVTPDKAGHVIYLEKLDASGNFTIVATRFVTNASTYQFAWRFGNAGAKTFRVEIPGGDVNVGAVSPTVNITVTLPPVTSLPPA